MKKVISLCLALCLIFAIGAFQVSAADGAVIGLVTDKTQIKAGDEVKVGVTLTDIDKLTGTTKFITGIEFNMSYDPDVFTLKTTTNSKGETSVISGAYTGSDIQWVTDVKSDEAKSSIHVMYWDYNVFGFDPTAEDETDGKTIWFTLIASEDIEAGSTTDLEITEIIDICDDKQTKVPDQFTIAEAVTLTVAEEAPVSSDPSEDPSKDPSKDPSGDDPSKTSSDDKSPATGDAGLLAVGALLAVAAGAAFVTMKKSK